MELKRIGLDEIVRWWKPGSGDWDWAEESRRLMQRPETYAIIDRIRDEGIGFADDLQPIMLGSDGRVWDGHHRIVIALHLGCWAFLNVEVV